MLLKCGQENRSVLAQLHGSCFREGWSAETFERLLASPGSFALLARHDTADIGFVLARIAADEAEILSVGVAAPARRQGFAAQMILAAATQADKAGATKMFLEVGTENAAAQALYRKLGFQEVGRRRGYYRDGSGDGITMRANLPLSRLGNGTDLD
jgi:ribosomal-protein-alanine N-acetyltransferase